MAQSGYTPIKLYSSTTPSATPTAGNLEQGELAINTNDGKLFYEDSSGVVQVMATKDAAAGNFATVDINGGTIDGTTIGGTTPAAGSFTNLAYTGTLTGGTGVINIGSGQVYKDASGNVGIGTASPATRLHVAGAITVASNAQWFTMGASTLVNSYGSFLKAGTTNIVGYIGTDGGGILSGGSGDNFGIRAENSLLFMSGGNNERMRLSSAGNLGLAVTPSSWNGAYKSIEIGRVGNAIMGGTSNSSIEVMANAFLNASGSYIYANNGAATDYYQSGGAHTWYTAPSGTAGNTITFSQAMTLNSSALSVNGVIQTESQGTSTSQLRAVNSGGTFYHGLDTSTGASFGAAYAAALWHSGNYPMIFATNNSEKMRLDAFGNLGLGATPSTWTARALEVGTIAASFSSVNGSDITFNAYYNGGWKYKSASYSAAWYSQDTSGRHIWYSAPAGTAGGAVSFQQSMSLTSGSVTELRLTSSGSIASGAASILRFGGTNSAVSGYVGYGGNANGYDVWNTLAGPIVFGTSNLTRMTIDASGYVGINTSPLGDSRIASRNDTAGTFAATFVNYSAGGYGVSIGSDSAYLVYFYNSGSRTGGSVGGITHNTTSTSYNTTSDYRLKNVTGELTESGSFIDAIKPKVGTWKSNGSPFVGFLAHEFAEVSPSSVTGEKDAVDADGKPIYQAMQASSPEVMANIIAELQSLRKRVAELEAA